MPDHIRKVTLDLQTVTPLFIRGADQNGPPELRSPAFRGVLRYWYRALLGGVIGDQNRSELQRLEALVFGATDCASSVSIRLHGSPETDMYPILPHKSDSARRKAFSPGQNFNLTLQAAPYCDDLVWKNACMALNLALLLGGFGLRSRRGAGNLQVIRSSDNDLVPTLPNDAGQIQTMIAKIIRSAIDFAKQLASREKVSTVGLPAKPTTFPCAARGASMVYVKNWGDDPTRALASLMQKVPKVKWLGGITPRQASPLWAHVFLTNGSRPKYHLLLTVLPSKLKTGDDHVQLEKWLRGFEGLGGQKLEIEGWNK
ncbi:MAG: type III-B CRISPR module RAMP protein Cmr1 [Anaerolineales bacterium]|jgi:CRISPR-associated protein Cmr1